MSAKSFISAEAVERLKKKIGFAELELFGSNFRLQLGEELKNSGWELLDSCFSSSVASPTTTTSNFGFMMEHSCKDRWSKTTDNLETLNCGIEQNMGLEQNMLYCLKVAVSDTPDV